MPDFADIATAQQPLPLPLSPAQLLALGETCRVGPATRLLDLGCGRGELLCQWAHQYHLQGTGVDHRAEYIDAAQHRAEALEVWSQLNFVISDEAEFPQSFHQYNIISSLFGMNWAETIPDTIHLLRPALKDDMVSLLVLADVFWQRPPTSAVCDALQLAPDSLLDLGQLSQEFDRAGVDLFDLHISSAHDWDKYHARQWQSVLTWLADNPTHGDAPQIHQTLRELRHRYLHYERDYIGWGVFVLVVGN